MFCMNIKLCINNVLSNLHLIFSNTLVHTMRKWTTGQVCVEENPRFQERVHLAKAAKHHHGDCLHVVSHMFSSA